MQTVSTGLEKAKQNSIDAQNKAIEIKTDN